MAAGATPRGSKKKKKGKVRGKSKGKKIIEKMQTEVMPPIAAKKAKANIDLFNLVMSGSDAN